MWALARRFSVVWVVVIYLSGMAQETAAPEVVFIFPQENEIVQDTISIVVEGVNFLDLKSFGFADFFYEAEEKITHLGRDQNTFDGLSLSWNTSEVSDGKYNLRVEVTDLFNLQGFGNTTVFVNNNGNQSFTARVARNLANAVASLARALDFPEDIELDNAIGIIRSNLEIAVITLDTSLRETQAIVEIIPRIIAETDPFLKNTALLRQLAKAVSAAQTSIEGLDLAAAQVALQDLVVAVRSFAQSNPNGIDLSPLNTVADGVEEASLQLEGLLEAIQGNQGSAVTEALQNFVDLARRVVPELLTVAASLQQANERCSISFSNSVNPISVSFAPNDTVRLIQVEGSQTAGRIELFDAQGKAILSDAFENTFSWDGRTDSGQMAGEGEFFFIMTLGNRPNEVIKTGRVVVLP